MSPGRWSARQVVDGWAMCTRVLKYFQVVLIVFCWFLLPFELWAGKLAQEQGPPPSLPNPGYGIQVLSLQADVDLYVKRPNGAPLEGTAVVTVIKLNGQVYDQKTAKDGYVRFNRVPLSEYNFQVVAPGYQRTTKHAEVRENSLTKITIEMTPMSDAEDAASSIGLSALPPKAQREVGKALEALRSNKPNDARVHLEAARKVAPTSAEIEYLFGVYSSQLKDE